MKYIGDFNLLFHVASITIDEVTHVCYDVFSLGVSTALVITHVAVPVTLPTENVCLLNSVSDKQDCGNLSVLFCAANASIIMSTLLANSKSRPQHRLARLRA